jgi:hypothetical protein
VSVCLLATIGLDGDEIVYDGPQGAHWRLAVADVRLIGVLCAHADGRDECVAFVTGSDTAWFQAPRSAVGYDELLAQLGAKLNDGVPFDLDRDVTRTGRVIWPAGLAESPMFELSAGHAVLSSALQAALEKR